MTLNEVVEKWEKQGRTPEQIYGVKNFVTSGPFLEWRKGAMQIEKDMDDQEKEEQIFSE